MKHGFLRVASASPQIKIADCQYNKTQIIKYIKKADANKASLVVFPELSVSGATCGDLFYHDVLLNNCENVVEEIIAETEDLEIVSIIGVPVAINNKIYSCGAVISKGELLGLVPKINVDKNSCFTSGVDVSTEIAYANCECVSVGANAFCCEDIENFDFAVEIGEDLWVDNSMASQCNPTIIANLSCSEYTVGKSEYREKLIEVNSGKLNCAYIYSDSSFGESTTDSVYSGENLIFENSKILAKGKAFEEDIIFADIDLQLIKNEKRKNQIRFSDEEAYDTISFELEERAFDVSRAYPQLPFIPESPDEISHRCSEILKIQSVALATRLKNIGSNKAVIGISGGLDSTLALIVAVHTFDLLKIDRKNIYAVTMPCFGTTKRTKSNAEKICDAYGVSFQEVDITKSVTQHFADIAQSIDDHNVTFENSQARERTQVLMDLANKIGGLVVGTGDLSELALGWATFNGDHMSMYGVNSSIPKTLVRYLVNYEAENSNKELSEPLFDILATPVSPELLPPKDNGEIAQKTEDVVGPYELHDFFMYYMLRYSFSPSKIFYIANIAFKEKYNKETIKKWLTIFTRRFFNQQFKRNCVPDGAKVGTISLSPRGAWKMPSDACSSLWLSELEDL